MNKTIPENKNQKKVSFNKDISQNPISDKRKIVSTIYSSRVLNDRISLLSKNALITPIMECLTSFVLETKIKKIRNQIAKAISLVENILNKLLISMTLFYLYKSTKRRYSIKEKHLLKQIA